MRTTTILIHNIMKTESIIALLAGTAIGVAVGVLIAPEKGSETRRKIKDAAENGEETAKEKILEQLKKLEMALTKEENTPVTEETIAE